MTVFDNHVHVGWYVDGYHSPEDIWEAERSAGVKDIVVSSTSTCAELYKLVVKEMQELIRLGGDHVHPLLWLTPRMLKTWGIRYMLHSKIKWEGIKIHPEAHHAWYDDKSLAVKAARIAGALHVPMLIHTGNFKESEAGNFEYLFHTFPDQQFIMAHGRPFNQASDLLKKYDNCFVDTAFMPAEDLSKLVNEGLLDKIYFGTDAPINRMFYSFPTSEFISNQLKEIKDKCGDAVFNAITSRTPYHKESRLKLHLHKLLR